MTHLNRVLTEMAKVMVAAGEPMRTDHIFQAVVKECPTAKIEEVLQLLRRIEQRGKIVALPGNWWTLPEPKIAAEIDALPQEVKGEPCPDCGAARVHFERSEDGLTATVGYGCGRKVVMTPGRVIITVSSRVWWND